MLKNKLDQHRSDGPHEEQKKTLNFHERGVKRRGEFFNLRKLGKAYKLPTTLVLC